MVPEFARDPKVMAAGAQARAVLDARAKKRKRPSADVDVGGVAQAASPAPPPKKSRPTLHTALLAEDPVSSKLLASPSKPLFFCDFPKCKTPL